MKQILILTTSNDTSSFEVINWINFYGYKAIIINENSKLSIKKIDFVENEICFKIDKVEYRMSNIISFWFRRGEIDLNFKELFNQIIQLDEKIILNHLSLEENSMKEFFMYCLNCKKNKINDYQYSITNKLYLLKKAKEVGLEIPKTLVISKKSDLLEFYKNNNHEIITKNIQDLFIEIRNNKLYKSLTNEIDKKTIDGLSDNFYPSLFQEKINRDFEVRSFYLNNTFYSQAIFSSSSDIDYRNYSKDYRISKFILPNEIKIKLLEIINFFSIDSGSIDLIYSKNKFYFLEINPFGQFGHLSFYNNYRIEQIIAKYLCEI